MKCKVVFKYVCTKKQHRTCGLAIFKGNNKIIKQGKDLKKLEALKQTKQMTTL